MNEQKQDVYTPGARAEIRPVSMTNPTTRNKLPDRILKVGMPTETKKLTFGNVNFRDPKERARFDEEMDKQLQANREAAVRDLQERGILDAHGQLIDRTLPPDMRPDSTTDFGG